MKLQTRIALSAAAAVLAAVALFAVGAYYLISERAYDRLDRSLSDTADRVAQELAGPRTSGDRDFAAPPTPALAGAAHAETPAADPAGTRVQLDPLGRTVPERPAHGDPPGRALPPAGAGSLRHRLGRRHAAPWPWRGP